MGYLLSDVCNEWLVADKGESQNNLFPRIYAIAVSGMRELHMDVNGLVKIAELTINDTDTVDLPSDYLQYSKVGLCGADGRIHSLGLDNDLCLNKAYNDCGARIAHSAFPSNNNISNENLLFGDSVLIAGAYNNTGGFFGLGGGNNDNGYFRYDRAANQLLLANMRIPSESIVLEYISDLTATEDGDFIVHPFEIECIKRWISWRYVLDNNNVSGGEKMSRERLFYLARTKMNKRYNSSTIQEWAESLRKSNTAAVRF
ncbi:MAG: hypothetical protein V4721_10160 [Bacteroidota bacterium]